MFLKILFLISLVLISQQSNQWVRSLTNQDFTFQLESTKNVWLVLTANQQSGEKYDVFSKTATILREIFNFGIKSGGQHPDGSLYLYGDDRKNPIQFTGKFSSAEIVKFVLQNFDKLVESRSKVAKQMKANQDFQRNEAERATKQWDGEQLLRQKSDTLLLNISNWDSFAKSRDAWVINFYQANCSACIQLNKQWEAISTSLKGKIRVAKINITEQGNSVLQEQLQIKDYPTIRYYAVGTKNIKQFSLFEGTKKKFSILEWINGKLSQKAQKASIPTLNKQNYETLCKNTKATCVIFFLDGDSQQTVTKIQALALKYLKNPISFLVAKKGQQTAFEKQVGVESYPDVAMMYCNRKSYWHAGGLDLKVVDDTIGEISLGNRNQFKKYKFSQEII